MAELAEVLRDGPGVILVRGAVPVDVVDRTRAVLEEILDEQRSTSNATGDHFAMAGTNDRIWNALEKLAVASPECFVDYYSSASIALASEAWLGPGYQITSQINIVNPGGVAQSPHRDYHLGFMSDEAAAAFPVHTHLLSPLLTLQGAVAHCDMPVESGPTKVLPHSHKYPPGLRGLEAARGDRAVRGEPRPAPARAGRRRVLQPGRLPRRRFEPHRPPAPHGQPAPGGQRVRPLHRGRRPRPHERSPCTRRCWRVRRPDGRPTRCSAWSPPRPRGTRSRPTSTATRRSVGWHRHRRPTSSAGRSPSDGSPTAWRGAVADARRAPEDVVTVADCTGLLRRPSQHRRRARGAGRHGHPAGHVPERVRDRAGGGGVRRRRRARRGGRSGAASGADGRDRHGAAPRLGHRDDPPGRGARPPRPHHRRVPAARRRAAGGRRTRGRLLRCGRRQRPHLERAREARDGVARLLRRLLRQRGRGAGVRGVARARPTR